MALSPLAQLVWLFKATVAETVVEEYNDPFAAGFYPVVTAVFFTTSLYALLLTGVPNSWARLPLTVMLFLITLAFGYFMVVSICATVVYAREVTEIGGSKAVSNEW